MGALWVERWRSRRAEQEMINASAERLREVASEVVNSLRYNQVELERLAALLQEGTVSLTPSMEMATWEMFRADVAVLFPDTDVKGELARFYSELDRIASASVLYRTHHLDDLLRDKNRERTGPHTEATKAIGIILGQHVDAALDNVGAVLTDVEAFASGSTYSSRAADSGT